MALSVKVASFTWNTADVAGTNYDVTLGFQPKVVILFMSGEDSAVDAVGRDSVLCGVGFGVSSSNRRGMIYTSADAQGTAALGVRHSDAAILSLSDVTGGTSGSDGDLDIAAEAGWPADGIRFTVDTQLVSSYGDQRISVLALGGDDITAQNTFAFQEPVAAGAQAVAHGLGATPTGAAFLSVGFGTAPPIGDTAQGCFSFGMTDGTRAWVLFVGGDDANTTMDTRSYCKSAECIAIGPEPAVTLDARAAITSFDATNINLDWTERAATRYVFGLVWAGGQFRVDNVLTATDLNNFTDTGYGFQPTLAMFASACRAESTADTPTDHAQFSIGAATSATERVAQAGLDEDGLATSECSTAIETDEVYANISTASAIQGLMDLVSFDADGMTLVMDDADPSASFVGVAVWAANAGAAAGQPTTKRYAGVPHMRRGGPTFGHGWVQ